MYVKQAIGNTGIELKGVILTAADDIPGGRCSRKA